MIETAAAPPLPRAAATPRRRAPGPEFVVAALMLVPIAVYLWVALHRLAYPYELDWMEGGSVGLAARVATGHSLYVAPTLGYVGWTYTPLYYVLSAGVSKLIGVGFLPLRLVSVIASLGAMAALAAIVRAAGVGRGGALLAAGLFAATYRLSGAWMDTGRVDALFLALTLAAIAAGARARGTRGGVAAGGLAFAAYFTKQTALIAVAPALLVLACQRPRAGLSALAVLGGLVVGSTVVLDAASSGWYRYYVIDELTHQPVAGSAWLGYWARDLLAHLWPSVAGGLAAAVVSRHRLRGAAYHLAAAAGLTAAAWISRLHSGGYDNVLMPGYAAAALLAGLAWGAAVKRGAAVQWGATALVALQLILLAYPIAAQLPTVPGRSAGADLLARLRSLHGQVLVLRHPWYAAETGHGSFAQEEAIGDVLRSGDPRGARILRASLRTGLDTLHIEAVVLDGTFDAGLLGPRFAREFRRVPGAITATALIPLTDVRTAPRLLYVRR